MRRRRIEAYDRSLPSMPFRRSPPSARSFCMLGRKRLENWKDVIDEEDRGVFLVDHLGRLIDRNEASEIFLKAAMRIRNRTLHLGDPQTERAFQHLVDGRLLRRERRSSALPPPVLWHG